MAGSSEVLVKDLWDRKWSPMIALIMWSTAIGTKSAGCAGRVAGPQSAMLAMEVLFANTGLLYLMMCE